MSRMYILIKKKKKRKREKKKRLIPSIHPSLSSLSLYLLKLDII